jgi:hypothetical protein
MSNSNLNLLMQARVAAINLSDCLCSWFQSIQFPRIKSDIEIYPSVILPALAGYWLDERRKVEDVLRPWLDSLTASRDQPIRWGNRWITSATAGWVELAACIETDVRLTSAETLLNLIDDEIPKSWTGVVRRCSCAETVISCILDHQRDDMVMQGDGRKIPRWRQQCERVGPIGVALYEKWSESEEFLSAIQISKCSRLCFRLESQLRFDFQLARVEVERDFALLTARVESELQGPSPIGTSSEIAVAPQYVTLNQAAAMVNKSKKTLERRKNEKSSTMPKPEVEGGGGIADEWLWDTIRPWLEAKYKKKLPVVFPK